MASYTFGGIACAPRADQFVPQVNPGESLYSVRPIPYANGASVLDLGGTGVRRYGPVEVKVAPASYAAFAALVQTTGTLVVNGTTYSNATLVSLTNHQISVLNDWHFVTAEWVIA